MDAQLKKGILEMCLLQAIGQESAYGYDVIQSLHGFFPDVAESTFYAVLRRLHREGMTETFEGPVSKGPARKYYRLTGAGGERLRQMREDWSYLQSVARALGL